MGQIMEQPDFPNFPKIRSPLSGGPALQARNLQGELGRIYLHVKWAQNLGQVGNPAALEAKFGQIWNVMISPN